MKEFRGALVRPFLNGRIDVGVNFLIASGYSGQTTENSCQERDLPAACNPSTVQEVVGVRIPSYASVSFTHRFGRPGWALKFSSVALSLPDPKAYDVVHGSDSWR